MNCGGAREGLISHLAVLMGRANRPCFAWLIVCWLYYCALSRCPLAVVSARPRRRQGPVINHVAATDSLSGATLIPVTQRNEGKERDERLKKGTKAKKEGEGEVRHFFFAATPLTCGCTATAAATAAATGSLSVAQLLQIPATLCYTLLFF